MINEIHTRNGKSIADVLNDFKNEVHRAVLTRAQLFVEEIKQKAVSIKASLPMLVMASIFLLTAWFLFTAAIVTLIAAAIPGNPWAYPIAFGAVMVLYALIGGILAMTGMKALRKNNLTPEKTIRVLREDGILLETEARRIA
ncbi:putative integral membrane protein [Candidatus Koribacter versatilis Ellin345]|uniref:Integral membrane protein n=1 Tax=Koribacter versatilis (strain Ellin345) TaxID=204669 RepID=Q1IUN8_KORVE|nr:phage holin family protein [Candidatus Koribacter versatilis]ABF39412.1 putative integral membrane protein [Candidatus Koribacter versatilis Ellin345]